VTDRDESADRAAPVAPIKSPLPEAIRYTPSAVSWVVEVDCLVLLPQSAAPVRLRQADAALWALLARGHELGAMVNMIAAVTGEPHEASARYVQRLLALWEEKGYVRRESANG